jgi:hypothetical protein
MGRLQKKSVKIFGRPSPLPWVVTGSGDVWVKKERFSSKNFEIQENIKNGHKNF